MLLQWLNRLDFLCLAWQPPLRCRPLLWLPLVLAGLSACGGNSTTGGPPTGMVVEVEATTVTPRQVSLNREFPGRLQAARTAEVRARVEGVVEQRLFKEGSDVKQGAPLFRIDPRLYQANLDSAKADAVFAKLTAERYAALLDDKAVSRQEFDQVQAKLKQAEAALAKASLDAENAHVAAPIAGRVGRALVTEGALVGKGEATPMTTIEQLDPIYVNFNQSQAELTALKKQLTAAKGRASPELPVQLILDGGEVYALPGKIVFSDLAVDAQTGSIAMRALFPNPGRILLPGMFVRVRSTQAEVDAALTVPQRAVQINGHGPYVMLINAESKAEIRPIKTAAMVDNFWVVESGLQAGDKVIVEGLQKAHPGTPVKIKEAAVADTAKPSR